MISTNFYKVEVDCRLVFIIKLPIAAPQCLKALLRGEGTACEARRTNPYCLSGSEFTGECAELAANFILRRGVVGSRGAAHKKAGTHRFCAAKLLALKSIGFLMTGKKKARRNAPAFQALFSQHGAKRLTFKRCLLAFLWAQFAFLLQAFTFLNKKKMPKRGIYLSSG